MKNLISILLITVYLFGNTEFGQIFNLPQLIKHYHQHYAADRSLSITKFMLMHYCGDDGISSDDDEDSKLPFKQIHFFSFIYFTKPAGQSELITNSVSLYIKQNSGFTDQYLPLIYPKLPLHPPRFIS